MLLLLILPWWRNHDHLRDFMDYGLVIAANGRIADGERPYVDFVTPIQAGFLWFNYQVETWTGGNYYGLTLGALPSLVGGFALLGYTHSRRWPWWWSLLAAWTVLMGSVGQHTIIWHNSLGVLCLAVALWVTTLWPGGSRPSWRWFLLLGVALAISGDTSTRTRAIIITPPPVQLYDLRGIAQVHLREKRDRGLAPPEGTI